MNTETKMTVGNGDFDSIEQKKKVYKQMISAMVHKGFNISSTADSLGITRQTIHNYMNEDYEFKQKVESGLIEEVGQKAMVRLTHKALIEDSETAQKYLLDKSGYWEKRNDVRKDNDTGERIIQVILPEDIKNVADSLIGDFDVDLSDPTEDQLQKVLRATDKSLNPVKSDDNLVPYGEDKEETE